MTRRSYSLRGLALAITAVMAIAACTQQPAASPTPGAQAQRGAGGDLKILYWQAATILNSHLAQGTKDFDASRLVLEPLAHMGPDGKPIAALAADVPTASNGGISSDYTTITWKLKPNVKWSDGSAFTSADVVFTYNFIKNTDTAATTSNIAEGVKSVQAVDPLTVKITFDSPNPNPYQIFVSGLGNILQEKQFKDFIGAKAKDAPGNQAPIGTGPYKVVQFKPDDVVTYTLNENYRDPNKPFFKTVTFKGGGDATSAARAVFQTGESDYSWNLQVEWSVLKPMVEASDSKGVIASVVSPNVERILINRTNPDPALGAKRAEPDQPHPFLTDLKVRQALAMAIDRKPLTDLYGGKQNAGEATCNIVTGVPDYTSSNTANLSVCKYDLAAANKLLDEAGWVKGADGIRAKGGKQMSIIYQTTVNPLRQKEQAIVKDGWTQLGIKVELKSVASGTFFSSGESPDTAAKFFTDVEMFTNGAESPDPTNYLSGWTCAEIKTAAGKYSGNNYERWCNKTFDDTFAQLKKENDPAKRKDLIVKLNDMLVTDVVIIPLVARNSVSGTAKSLKGIKMNPWDSEMWNIADWTK